MKEQKATLWRVYKQGEYLGKVGQGYSPMVPTTRAEAQLIAESVFGEGVEIWPVMTPKDNS